ncbi:hypothetical protein RP20_CCG003477 [Aedes albopictus]|nr:hypothetical protein RP20_CCG003477 [Aedes albopictus]
MNVDLSSIDNDPKMPQNVDNEHLMDDDDLTGDHHTEVSKAKHSTTEGGQNTNSKCGETPKQVFSWKDLCKQKGQVCKPASIYKITEVLPRPKLIPHTCYICGTVHEDADALDTHLEQHVDQIPFQCNPCSTEQVPQVFRTLITLNRHLRTHLYPYTCDYCPLRFQLMPSYHTHMQEMHLANQSAGFTCDLCGKFFVRKRLFQTHWYRHKAIQEEKYKCEFCGKVFGTGVLLKRHVLTHTGETPYECKKCGRRFNHEHNFQLHKRLHIGEKGYACEECDKSFLNNTYYRMHMQKHFPNDPRYFVRSKLKKPGVEGEYACDYGDCTFVTKKYQTYHAHRAKHLKRFVCEICGKNFPMKYHLVKHKGVVHEGKAPERFKCPHCPKEFNAKQKLNKHIDVHENNRRYKCQYCEKAFVCKDNCKAHERIHTGERPYPCRMCPSAFISSSGRKKHEAIHNRAESLELA